MKESKSITNNIIYCNIAVILEEDAGEKQGFSCFFDDECQTTALSISCE